MCNQYQLPKTFSVEVPEEDGTEGIEALLAGLPARLDEARLQTLGIVVDADRDLVARWQAVRDRLTASGYQNIPKVPPAEGWVYAPPDLLRAYQKCGTANRFDCAYRKLPNKILNGERFCCLSHILLMHKQVLYLNARFNHRHHRHGGDYDVCAGVHHRHHRDACTCAHRRHRDACTCARHRHHRDACTCAHHRDRDNTDHHGVVCARHPVNL